MTENSVVGSGWRASDSSTAEARIFGWSRFCVVQLVVLLFLTLGCREFPEEGVVLDPGVAKEQIREIAAELEAKGFLEQASLLEDGVVTDAEHRQSAIWTLECIERNGLQSSQLWRDETLTSYTFQWGTYPGPGGSDELDRIMTACQTEFNFGVQRAWKLQDRGVIRAELVPDLVVCLRGAGVEIGDEPTVDDIRVAGRAAGKDQAAMQCVNDAVASLDHGPSELPPLFNSETYE